MLPSITYTDHNVGALQLAAAFPGLAPEELPDGEGWASEVLTLSTHNGTHVDAPWHYHSTSEGRRAATIDEAPLDLFMRPGVTLDFRAKPDGHVVSAAEVQREFDRIRSEERRVGNEGVSQCRSRWWP